MTDTNFVASAANVTSKYLYGLTSTPNLITDRLRNLPSDAVVDIGSIDTGAYLAEYAKYAVPARAQIVKDFFGGALSLSAGSYTVSELQQSNAADLFEFSYQNAQVDINSSTYMERAYTFGHSSFRLSSDTVFVVGIDGTRTMENVSITPLDDNFDYVSTGIAQYLNDYYLQPTIDPSVIGRKVTWSYSGQQAAHDYTARDFQLDTDRVSAWDVSKGVAAAYIGANIYDFVEQLRSRGVFQTELDGRQILYDGQSSGDVHVNTGTGRAAIFVGGAGSDRLQGGLGNDIFYGGAEDDIMFGGGGSDVFWGGDEPQKADYNDHDIVSYANKYRPVSIEYNGLTNASALTVKTPTGIDQLHSIEQIVGSTGRDTLTIKGLIASGTTLTIDANGGQSPNPRDTIDVRQAGAGGISIVIDATSGTGYIKSTATNGKIDLIGFHTGILGSAYDDRIDDKSTGHKQIYAGDGDDIINVGDGGAAIDGGKGNDKITGGAGNDLLVGGQGQNDLIGGAGHDRIIVTGDGDQVRGGTGNDYIVALAGLENAIISGNEGNDLIDLSSLVTKQSEEQIPLSRSRDLSDNVYEFNVGDGQDTFVGREPIASADPYYDDLYNGLEYLDYGSATININNVSLEDLSFIFNVTKLINNEYSGYAVEGSLAIIISETGDSLYFDKVAALGYYPMNGPDTVGLIGSWTLPPIVVGGQLLMYNTETALVIVTEGDTSPYNTADGFASAVSVGLSSTGGLGDDIINGGSGDDQYEASGGRDTFDGGMGDDTLSLFASAATFSFERKSDGSVTAISSSGLEGSVTISNVENIYSIADETIYSLAALAGDYGSNSDDSLIKGTRNSDNIFGLLGDDTLYGGMGDDFIDGGDGSDTAIYTGDLADYSIYRDIDNILTVKSINPTRTGDGTDKLIGIEFLKFELSSQRYDVSAVPSLGTIANDIIIGDAYNNVLYGLSGDDILNGGLSSDVMFGGYGSDVYSFIAGGGHDIINDDATLEWSDIDVLDLSTMSISDVFITRDWTQYASGDLLFTFNPTGDSIRVVGQFSDWQDQGIERVNFAGGLFMDRQLMDSIIESVGTSASDVMYGSMVGGNIRGGEGDDIIFSPGTDTIFYNAGDGNDTINDEGPYRDGDTLKLAGFTQEDVSFVRSGNDLIIGIASTNNTIKIVNQFQVHIYGPGSFSYGNKGVEYLEFADGIPIRVDDIADQFASTPSYGTDGSDIIAGTRYADIIYGLEGDDTLRGVSGGDLLDGGDGSDNLHGTDMTDILNGGAGDDYFRELWGADIIDGGDGIDTAVYFGFSSDYDFRDNQDGTTRVFYNSGYSGWQDFGTIKNVEIAHFIGENTTIALSNLAYTVDYKSSDGNNVYRDSSSFNEWSGSTGTDETFFNNAAKDTLTTLFGVEDSYAITAGNISNDYAYMPNVYADDWLAM